MREELVGKKYAAAGGIVEVTKVVGEVVTVKWQDGTDADLPVSMLDEYLTQGSFKELTAEEVAAAAAPKVEVVSTPTPQPTTEAAPTTPDIGASAEIRKRRATTPKVDITDEQYAKDLEGLVPPEFGGDDWVEKLVATNRAEAKLAQANVANPAPAATPAS